MLKKCETALRVLDGHAMYIRKTYVRQDVGIFLTCEAAEDLEIFL